MACLAASAADSVMVITKSVAAKPSRTRTSPLPFQPLRRFSSIGDRALPGVAASGHLRVDRQRAEQRDEHEDDGGDRGHAPAASSAMPGW
jgi:hypothetical protein